jgi:hypothetical protein
MTLEEFRNLRLNERNEALERMTPAEAVAHGVEWLDATIPDWREQPATWSGFHIGSGEHCVAGKLAYRGHGDMHNYSVFVRRHSLNVWDRAFLGFSGGDGDALYRVGALQNEWLKVLPKR